MTRDELELLTIPELAELLHLSVRTIERRVASGEIPSVRIGGARRIRLEEAARIVNGDQAIVGPPNLNNEGSHGAH